MASTRRADTAILGRKTMSKKDTTNLRERLSTCGWFMLCLMLFLLLGPFSAPVVLIVLFREGLTATGLLEPEPVTMG